MANHSLSTLPPKDLDLLAELAVTNSTQFMVMIPVHWWVKLGLQLPPVLTEEQEINLFAHNKLDQG
jgi:hypothetical protein